MLVSMKKKNKSTVKKVSTKKKPAPKKAVRRMEVPNDVRSLTRVSGGTSYAITLPHGIVDAFKWKARQKLKLDVNMKSKTITIRDWKK